MKGVDFNKELRPIYLFNSFIILMKIRTLIKYINNNIKLFNFCLIYFFRSAIVSLQERRGLVWHIDYSANALSAAENYGR